MLFFRSLLLVAGVLISGTLTAFNSLSAEEVDGFATDATLGSASIQAVGNEPLRLGPPRENPDAPSKRWTLADSGFSTASFSKTLPRTSGQIGLMLGIFAALVLIWRMASTRSNSLPSNLVEVYGKVPMTGKQSLHLVRVGSRLLILIETAQGMQRLAEISDPEEVRSVVEQLGKGHSHRLPQGIKNYVDERHLSSFRTG